MQFPLTPFRPLPGTTSLILTPGPTIQSYDGFGNGHCTLVEIMHRDAPWLVLCGLPVFYFLHFIDHVASSYVSLSFSGTERVSSILFLFHGFFPYLHSGRVHVVICCHMLSSVLNLGSSRRFESGAHPKWTRCHTAATRATPRVTTPTPVILPRPRFWDSEIWIWQVIKSEGKTGIRRHRQNAKRGTDCRSKREELCNCIWLRERYSL